VETAEFLAISDQIKDRHDREAKEKQDAQYAAQEKKMAELLSQLDQARADLKTVNAKEQDLARKVHAVSGGKPGRVKTAGADLKAEPYNQSKTLKSLSQGDAVTVLLETRSWYRVQAASGEQGWVYRLMLEVTE
jgi:SH3-like domain-containing protein